MWCQLPPSELLPALTPYGTSWVEGCSFWICFHSVPVGKAFWQVMLMVLLSASSLMMKEQVMPRWSNSNSYVLYLIVPHYCFVQWPEWILCFRAKSVCIPAHHMLWHGLPTHLWLLVVTNASWPTEEMDASFNSLTTVERKMSMSSPMPSVVQVGSLWSSGAMTGGFSTPGVMLLYSVLFICCFTGAS